MVRNSSIVSFKDSCQPQVSLLCMVELRSYCQGSREVFMLYFSCVSSRYASESPGICLCVLVLVAISCNKGVSLCGQL